jgi:glutaryl-CoA dehydrogenase
MTDDGIRGFIIEKGMKGFSAPEIERKFSLARLGDLGTVLRQCRGAGVEACCQGVKGLKGPLSCLTQARYGITWGVIGAAQACLAQLIDYTKTREMFGRPLAATQAIQLRLAEMARKITTAQLLSHQLGPPQGPGQDAAAAGIARQVEQLPHGARYRARLPRHAGRSGHQRRSTCPFATRSISRA